MVDTVEFRITQTYWRTKHQYLYGVPVISGTSRKKSANQHIRITALRNQLPFEPSIGQQWKVTGDCSTTQEAKYKRLIQISHFEFPDTLEITLPEKDQGFIHFVANEFDHVSVEKADHLWAAFGKSIYSILAAGDTERLMSVKGIGEAAANSLVEGYKKFTNLKHCNWLAQFKVPLPVQLKLIKYHTDLTIDVIKKNPYELVTFGMPFKDVDQIARQFFKVSLDSEQRLAAATRQAMNTLCRKNGHTYIDDRPALQKEISKLVKADQVNDALKAAKRAVNYIQFKNSPDRFHHHDLLLIETAVARRISELLSMTPPDWRKEHDDAYSHALNELDYDLTDKQKNAVMGSLYSTVSLITGGAGTGKTTVTRTVLRAYDQMDYKITALALSGRAAMRLHQSIDYPTGTIAKFLRNDPLQDVDQDGNEIKHILVIDESSMVDIASMYRIINHIPDSCRLLFVGDPHQLPPIQAGLVLAELDKVDAIEKTHLDIVKRQEASTGIPEYSLSIRNGEVPTELTTGAITFHNSDDYNDAVNLFMSDPTNSMVVAATKQSVNELNALIQQKANPDSPEFRYQDADGQWYAISGGEGNAASTTLHLRLNDPVIFIQNNYEAGYQNGSLGILTSITQDVDAGTYGTVKLLDNGNEINLTFSMLDHLRAAYAITLHKAQGSQFKNCIVYLDKTAMVDRSWVYTAVTRSEKSLHIVGTTARFKKAIQSESAFSKRNAHLGWLITQYTRR